MSLDLTHAVVLSGGGAKGAYEVGVMKALFQGESPSTAHRTLDPAVFTGTSVGSYNAAVMVSRPQAEAAQTILDLERIWTDRIADREGNGENGVFRFRGLPYGLANPAELVRNPLKPMLQFAEDAVTLTDDYWRRIVHLPFAEGPISRRLLELVSLSAWISMEPFQRLLDETLPAEDILDSPKSLRVAATDWRAGRLRVFRNRAGSGDDSFVQMEVDSVRRSIAASSAIPGIFPSVELDRAPHVDGGAVMNTPLRSAILAGAETIHVVYLDPELEDIPLGRLENTVDTLERLFVLMMAVITNRDIAAARRINEMVTSGTQPRSASRRMRPLTIHRYRPRGDLGGLLGLLDFRKATVLRLIEQGREDARAHDCAACGCIFPE